MKWYPIFITLLLCYCHYTYGSHHKRTTVAIQRKPPQRLKNFVYFAGMSYCTTLPQWPILSTLQSIKGYQSRLTHTKLYPIFHFITSVVMRRDESKEWIFSFRGTQNRWNQILDVQMGATDRVHWGFDIVYASLKAKVRTSARMYKSVSKL